MSSWVETWKLPTDSVGTEVEARLARNVDDATLTALTTMSSYLARRALQREDQVGVGAGEVGGGPVRPDRA